MKNEKLRRNKQKCHTSFLVWLIFVCFHLFPKPRPGVKVCSARSNPARGCCTQFANICTICSKSGTSMGIQPYREPIFFTLASNLAKLLPPQTPSKTIIKPPVSKAKFGCRRLKAEVKSEGAYSLYVTEF